MNTGTLKFFDARTNGWGFIIPDAAGPDVFLHANVVKAYGLTGNDLPDGQRIRYRFEADHRGRLKATFVEIAPAFGEDPAPGYGRPIKH